MTLQADLHAHALREQETPGEDGAAPAQTAQVSSAAMNAQGRKADPLTDPHQAADRLSPLTEARAGERLCVRSVAGSPTFLRRMMDLGLRAGIPIEIVHKNPAGVVVRLDGMRMAISPAAGRHIFVTPCPGRTRR